MFTTTFPRNHANPFRYKKDGEKRSLDEGLETVGYVKLHNNVAIPIWKEKPTFDELKLQDYANDRAKSYGTTETILHTYALRDPMELVHYSHINTYGLVHPTPMGAPDVRVEESEFMAVLEGIFRRWNDDVHVPDRKSVLGYKPFYGLQDYVTRNLVSLGFHRMGEFQDGLTEAQTAAREDRVAFIGTKAAGVFRETDGAFYAVPERFGDVANVYFVPGDTFKNEEGWPVRREEIPLEVLTGLGKIEVAFRKGTSRVWKSLTLARRQTLTSMSGAEAVGSGAYADFVVQGDHPKVRNGNSELNSSQALPPVEGYESRPGIPYPVKTIGWVSFPSRSVRVLHGLMPDAEGYLNFATSVVTGEIETRSISQAYITAANRMAGQEGAKELLDFGTALEGAPPTIMGIIRPGGFRAYADLYSTTIGKEAEDSQSRQLVRDVVLSDRDGDVLTLGELADQNTRESSKTPVRRAVGIFMANGTVKGPAFNDGTWRWDASTGTFSLFTTDSVTGMSVTEAETSYPETSFFWLNMGAESPEGDAEFSDWLRENHPSVHARSAYATAHEAASNLLAYDKYSLPFTSGYYEHPLGGIKPESADIPELMLLMTSQGSDLLELVVGTHLMGIYGWVPESKYK